MGDEVQRLPPRGRIRHRRRQLEGQRQAVEPRDLSRADEAGSQEDRRRQPALGQDGRGVGERVAVTVVEGDGERVAGERVATHPGYQFLDGQDLVGASDVVDPALEDPGGQ